MPVYIKILLLLSVLIIGCSTNTQTYNIHKIEILSTTNFASVSKDEKQKNVAIVFLSGTSGSPQSHKLLLQTMIKNGFHVIALDYPNKDSVGSIAKNNLDEWENIREEIVTGNDKTQKNLIKIKACYRGY